MSDLKNGGQTEFHKKLYKTTRWKKIRQAVITRDGGICYFCHRLVLKRPTIHHIKEIDESNYLDEEVAFNLDNLVLCHAECHNLHHDRFSKSTICNYDLSVDYAKRDRKEKKKQ